MKPFIEEKKRYKMYKAGKHWVVAPIVFFSLLGVTGLATTNAEAAEVSTVEETATQVVSSSVAEPQEIRSTDQTGGSEDTLREEVTVQSSVKSQEVQNIVGETPSETHETGEKSKETPTSPVAPEVPSKENIQATGKETVSSTDSSKVNVPSTSVEIQTPELDKAVAEANKAPNVTVTEEKENLGAMTKEEVAKKKAEIDKEQKAKAKEIEQKVKATQEANQKIAEENARKKAEYEKKMAEHKKSLEEAKKNKQKPGYLNSEQMKYLIFDQTSTKNSKLVSVKADQYIDAKKFFEKYPQKGQEQKHLYQRLANDSSPFLTKDAGKGKTGEYTTRTAWVAVLQKNRPVVVVYENLNGSYNGKKITKVEYTYTLRKTPDKNGRLNAYFHDDPVVTITYGIPIDKAQSAEVEIEMLVKFFGTDGKEILPEKGKPFLYSGASLNSRGKDISYEYMTLGDGNQFLKINGSKVDQHGKQIYSTTDIDTGTDGIVTEDWDGVKTGKEYLGAGVVMTDKRIHFTFGNIIKKNPGFTGSSMWFAFNTDLKAYTVTPKPAEVHYESPKNVNIHYKKYELFERYTPTPTKSVKDSKKVNINHKNIMRGDRLNYEMTWDLKGYGSHFQVESKDVVKGIHFTDDYDETRLVAQKELFRVTDAKGNSLMDQLDVIWDDVKGIVTVTAKDPEAFIKAFGGTELHVFFATKVKGNVTGEIVNRAVQHTFGQSVETESVTNPIPKINPKKDVVVTVGDTHSLNHGTIENGQVFNYQLQSSIRPGNFGGITEEWSIVDVLSTKDQATGHHLVLATRDFVLADGTVVKAGTDITNYFFVRVSVNENGQQVYTFTAKPEFLALMNQKENREMEQGWAAYIQVKRIGYGEVENTFEESYNGEHIQSNTVVTHTPQPTQPETPKNPSKPAVPEERVKEVRNCKQELPVQTPIRTVQPKKVAKAGMIPIFPKTGEKNQLFLGILGGIFSLSGLIGFGWKRKKDVTK
ncbi:LPXTG cell wall anchor domain-containing protein [Enterococcus faecalis]|nr:LPXTG cell wall anchor domain-containing protein [Enterococcus faecalis]